MVNVMRIILFVLLVTASISNATTEFIRWTFHDQSSADLSSVLVELNLRTGYKFTAKDFEIVDDRDLAFSHYKRFLQVKLGTPIEQASLRIWSKKESGELLQVEASVEDPQQQLPQIAMRTAATHEAKERVKRTIKTHPHKHGAIKNMTQKRMWQGTRLVEIVTISTTRGIEKLTIDAATGALLNQTFKPYPSHDAHHDITLNTHVYPVYEEYNGRVLETIPTQLKYLKSTVRIPDRDPYAHLRDQHFWYHNYDSLRGATPEGRARGFWSFPWLMQELDRSAAIITPTPNSFDEQGIFLEGRYATVSMHPDAANAFGPFSFEPRLSERVFYEWREDHVAQDWEIIPLLTSRTKPWMSSTALQNPAIVRHINHDPHVYIENGFDEIQVYYGITSIFDALRPMGFTDPDLSERPFHAFLYLPDIEWKNNAFYTYDTINFTTYSADSANMARDNTTIWHEVGHGIMERLMGMELNLADTGGLSEGMADFVALLVLEAKTQGLPFFGSDDQRIKNNTGFFLTNEVHDDGEAYGGAMKQILDSAIAQYGRVGLVKVADLILEAMRLCRDHPHLTADDWFLHMRFADEIGRVQLREPNELRSLIDNALISRNYGTEEERVKFSLKYLMSEVAAGSPGSRDNEISVTLAAHETGAYPLLLSITDGTLTKLNYPVTIKVAYTGGALQGSVDWVNEDAGPLTIVLDAPRENVEIPLALNAHCDNINRDDGSCSDYAYVQIFEHGANKPIGKKRFYVKLTPQDTAHSIKI